MKKFLIGIFSVVLGFVGFSSAVSFTVAGEDLTINVASAGSIYAQFFPVQYIFGTAYASSCSFENFSYTGPEGGTLSVNTYSLQWVTQEPSWVYVGNFGDSVSISNDAIGFGCYLFADTPGTYNISFDSLTFTSDVIQEPVGGGGTPEDITVYYNNGNSSTDITCDGTQAIEINGLSTITSSNTFTPYFNVSYNDEDNQSLIESYSKDILYLENGLFKKTYTGNNDWILTYQGNNSENTFTGYVPVFEVTGSTQPVDTDYNMFNNFTDNSLKVLLSNIPGYIQYVFIIGIILFLLGIVKMFKKRK